MSDQQCPARGPSLGCVYDGPGGTCSYCQRGRYSVTVTITVNDPPPTIRGLAPTEVTMLRLAGFSTRQMTELAMLRACRDRWTGKPAEDDDPEPAE